MEKTKEHFKCHVTKEHDQPVLVLVLSGVKITEKQKNKCLDLVGQHLSKMGYLKDFLDGKLDGQTKGVMLEGFPYGEDKELINISVDVTFL